jgi:ADP-ribose pyrophosphatase YjhB (NUDIX family)
MGADEMKSYTEYLTFHIPARTTPTPTFGVAEAATAYTERRAAYGVALGENETVAVLRGPSGRLWLPGGGSLPGESAEATLTREVREELAQGVRLIRAIGEAIQFFRAATEGRYYRMCAVFFEIELTGELPGQAEYAWYWLHCDQARAGFFHECHGWAVDQAFRSSQAAPSFSPPNTTDFLG